MNPHSPALASPPLEDGSLPRQLTGVRSPIIWGVILLVAIEGTLLALFVVSWFYLRLGTAAWPPAGIPEPDLFGPTLAQGLLLASVLPAWLGLRALARGGSARPLVLGLPVGLLLALGYLIQKGVEYAGRGVRWDAHAYASMDWTMSGYAGLHVAVVLLVGAVVWVLALRGHFSAARYTGVQAFVLYWAFVAIGSAAFYLTQYLAPRL